MKSAVLLFISLTFSLQGFAQVYPSDRPIRLIVPSTPGGNIDITARVIAGPLGELLGQTVVVENKPGVGTMLGANFVAKAPADGHTLLMGSNSSLTVAPSLYKNPLYDPQKDLAPVSLVSVTPYFLLANSTMPAKTLGELITQAQKQPGQITLANPGVGTSNHLVNKVFENITKTEYLHVPYHGGGPALQAVLSGQANLYINQQSASLPSIESGKVRALAVTSAQRSPLAPNIPTMAELGFPEMNAVGITGVLAPRGTPESVITKINAAIQKVINQPDTKRRFETMGTLALGGSPDAFKSYIKTDFDKWAKIIKDGNMSAD
jgi:hypothetical protein